MPDVRLRVENVDYGGWTSMEVVRSLEQLAGTFDLTVSESWASSGVAVHRPLRPGQLCQVLLDGKSVMAGQIDDVAPQYDARTHSVRVSGRDLTADLVDCSAATGRWKGIPLTQLALILCEPFGIDVAADVDTGLFFREFAVEEGETVFEALSRAARMRAAFLVSNGKGGILITRASRGVISTQLNRPGNILAASAVYSLKERFSDYTVKGQQSGDDDVWGGAAAQPWGSAEDDGVSRYRPLLVLAEDQGGDADFAQRATWERAVRLGKGTRVEITVQGWTHADGLWTPNCQVHVSDEWLGLDMDLLLVGVQNTLDESGTRTVLTLTRPEAYSLLASPESTNDPIWPTL